MDVHEQNRARIRRLAQGAARSAAAGAGPATATRRIQRLIDDELRRLPVADRAPVACAAGCALCCHLRVVATPAEVFGLVDFLERTLDADAFAAFRARASATAERVSALSDERLLTTNVACPALVDGRCSGYAARPLNCRSYHSLSLAACQASFDAPDDLSLGHPQYGAVARVHEGAQGGYIDGLAAAGYDAAQYELATALAEVLSDPDARARFERGDKAFHRARQVV